MALNMGYYDVTNDIPIELTINPCEIRKLCS